LLRQSPRSLLAALPAAALTAAPHNAPMTIRVPNASALGARIFSSDLDVAGDSDDDRTAR